MKLRNELEPNIKKAEELFPLAMELLMKFDVAFNNFDENEMDNIIKQINQLTNNQIDKEDIYKYWGYTSAEDLVFSFVLPFPARIESITKEEISEIKQRIELLSKYDDNEQKSISEYLFNQNVQLSFGLINEYYSPLLDYYESDSKNIIYL
nr:hypothetical protein [uncultured Flavobacterium sp.]